MIFFLAFLGTYLSYSHSAINNAVIAIVQQLLTMGRLILTRFFFLICPNQCRENYFVKLLCFLWLKINRLFNVVERDIIKISVLKKKQAHSSGKSHRSGSAKWRLLIINERNIKGYGEFSVTCSFQIQTVYFWKMWWCQTQTIGLDLEVTAWSSDWWCPSNWWH